MKLRAIVLSLLFFGVFAGCNKEQQEVQVQPNAVIVGQGMDCGDTYLIRFNNSVTGPDPNLNNTYYAIDLPASFKVNDLPVYIEYRMPYSNELMACTTMGPGYTHILITHIE